MGIPRVSGSLEAALSHTACRRVALRFLALAALASIAGCATMRTDNSPTASANDATDAVEDTNVGRFVERSVRVDGAEHRYRVVVPAQR